MSDYRGNPEREGELKSLDLGPVVEEVEKYNHQYSMGPMLARALMRGMDDEQGDSLVQQEQESRQAFLQRIENSHGITLAMAGINLEPVQGNITALTEEGNIDNSELRINLKDNKQFTIYISSLEADTVKPSQIEGLAKVATSLRDQLKTEYSLEKPDARAGELIAGLDDLIEHYKRLDPNGDKGLVDSVKDLEKYLEFARKNSLKEYLFVERAGLLAEVGGQNFGPSQWHTDMSEGNYEKRWQAALSTLDQIKRNHAAAELTAELSAHLIQSAKYAKTELEKQLGGEEDNRIQNKLMTLAQVARTLSRSLN